MADEMDLDREQLLVSVRWADETSRVSLDASGLLVTLVRMAAAAGSAEIPVSYGNVAPQIKTAADRERFAALIAELRLAGLVRPVRAGIFAIAPGLWKVGRWDPGDRAFVPLM